MSWNEEEMIAEMPVVSLKLDEAVEILVQLKAFNIALYKDILHTDKDSNIELALKADLGMIVLNEKIFNNISSVIEDILTESNFFTSLMLIGLQEKMYESVVDHLYHEAKEQIENEE